MILICERKIISIYYITIHGYLSYLFIPHTPWVARDAPCPNYIFKFTSNSQQHVAYQPQVLRETFARKSWRLAAISVCDMDDASFSLHLRNCFTQNQFLILKEKLWQMKTVTIISYQAIGKQNLFHGNHIEFSYRFYLLGR